MKDMGLSAAELKGLAAALGVLALVGWVRVAFLLDDPIEDWSPQLGITFGVAVLASVFSAACAVLSGVKAAAGRLGDTAAAE